MPNTNNLQSTWEGINNRLLNLNANFNSLYNLTITNEMSHMKTSIRKHINNDIFSQNVMKVNGASYLINTMYDKINDILMV